LGFDQQHGDGGTPVGGRRCPQSGVVDEELITQDRNEYHVSIFYQQ
jgi:hypothetical protein